MIIITVEEMFDSGDGMEKKGNIMMDSWIVMGNERSMSKWWMDGRMKRWVDGLRE
jgi:hypothetical protein